MREEIKIGTKVKTESGREWTLTKHLGGGGQGEVYEVTSGGDAKALKWYKEEVATDKLRENIRCNIFEGAPADFFLWPLEITEERNNSFGYIMDLKPDGFYDLTDFLLGKIKFPSFRRVADTALNIVYSFRLLHNKGYCYQDINDGNFFVNPSTGEVRICDNDNVALNGVDAGILGKPRYMAPEITVGKNKPDICSDRFSMAVIIYILFTLNHPLEGRASIRSVLTPEMEKSIYGTNATFVMDPDDDANRPHPKIHGNAIAVWDCLPDYMKEIFLKVFGKKGLNIPNSRPAEAEWIQALVRFRSSIMTCSCRNEVFAQEGKEATCECCGAKLPVKFWLKLPYYSIPGVKNSRIYLCQTKVVDIEDALKPVARVVASKNDRKLLGIQNMSNNTWDVILPDEEKKQVEKKQVTALKENMKIKFENTEITVERGEK